MRKELLAEEFMNASKEYSKFQGAMLECCEDNPIMECLIGQLNKLANDYYMSIISIYRSGMTLDEVLKCNV
jgi:hypothetical protein